MIHHDFNYHDAKCAVLLPKQLGRSWNSSCSFYGTYPILWSYVFLNSMVISTTGWRSKFTESSLIRQKSRKPTKSSRMHRSNSIDCVVWLTNKICRNFLMTSPPSERVFVCSFSISHRFENARLQIDP